MQLGDWFVMQQRVSMRRGLEMASPAGQPQAEKRISFLYFPGLFRNAGNAARNIASPGISLFPERTA